MNEEDAMKHLGKAEFKIGDDTFELKSIGSENIPLMFMITQDMERIQRKTKALPKEEQESGFFQNMSEELVDRLTTLCNKTMEKSYPEWDEEVRSRFVASNFMVLMKKVIELNQLGGSNSNDREMRAKAKRMQANTNAGDGVGSESPSGKA